MKILLDTCVLIDDDYTPLPGVTYLASTLSKAELEAGVRCAKNKDERTKRQERLDDLNADFDWLPFTEKAAEEYGYLSTELRRAGKKSLARSVDIFLAAQARALDAEFMTSNKSDFKYLQDTGLVPIILI